MSQYIANIRNEYKLDGLLEQDAHENPLKQFEKWFEEVIKSDIDESNAMVLSTCVSNKPSSRVVLLKGIDAHGFVFFTNYQSKKGKSMALNPQVSLNFFWKELERQVRVEGLVEKVTAEESDIYFASRPRASQIGAWVSAQSEVIPDRETLAQQVQNIEAKFEGVAVSRPPHWGGYRVIPHYIEFWQGRPSRLHDRIAYTLNEDHSWKIERLSP
jgi:pyridoxamine 5'-phosphate oxidase